MKNEREMMLLKSGYSGEQLIPAATWALAEQRTIYLTGEVSADMALDFRKQLEYLAAQDDTSQPVTVVINSPGGSVTDGLAICDAMQKTSLTLNLVCYGSAYSMAAIILAVGKKGHRYITKHSFVMIHEPRTTVGGGTVSSMEAQAALGRRFRDVVNRILAEHTSHTLDEIEKATTSDNFMDAEQALEFGIVDEIL